jgi:hypothetical protein
MLRAKAREIQPELKLAREIAGKAVAENREMTASERVTYDAVIAGKRSEQQAASMKSMVTLLQQLNANLEKLEAV